MWIVAPTAEATATVDEFGTAHSIGYAGSIVAAGALACSTSPVRVADFAEATFGIRLTFDARTIDAVRPGRALDTASPTMVIVGLEINAHILAAGFRGETFGARSGVAADSVDAVFIRAADDAAAAAILIIAHQIETNAVAAGLPCKAGDAAATTVIEIGKQVNADIDATIVGEISPLVATRA